MTIAEIIKQWRKKARDKVLKEIIAQRKARIDSLFNQTNNGKGPTYQ